MARRQPGSRGGGAVVGAAADRSVLGVGGAGGGWAGGAVPASTSVPNITSVQSETVAETRTHQRRHTRLTGTDGGGGASSAVIYHI